MIDTDKVICKNCGLENNSNSKYCKDCGHELPKVEIVAADNSVVEKNVAKGDNKKKILNSGEYKLFCVYTK